MQNAQIYHQHFTEKLINDLANHGYAICNDFLLPETVTSLADEAGRRYLAGDMAQANTGQHAKTFNTNIRGDHIFWLNETAESSVENTPNNMHKNVLENTSIRTYLNQMHTLKDALNQHLFMNLHEIETHLAVYPIGSYYAKHLDQFSQGEGFQKRQLSSVLYLNHNWRLDDGGALRLHLSDSQYIDIAPTAGKLVLFLSPQFWHEVLPAKRLRASLTGWFKTRLNTMI